VDSRISDGTVVVSISGGKDSAATSLHLKELGIEHRRVVADTGWEEQRWLDYVRGPLTAALGPIDMVRANIPLTEREFATIRLACRNDNPLILEMLDSPMVRLVLSKAMFPSRVKKFCTDHLKLHPIRDYLANLDNPVSAIGIRAEESQKRASMTEWEWSDGLDCWVWRPILQWSVADIIAIHARHGLRPNPLYLEGHDRLGCWLCIESPKKEVRLVSLQDPKRIQLIKQLERVVNRLATWQMRGRGQQLSHRRTFFQSLGKYDKQRKGVAIPGLSIPGSTQPLIEDVVRWAQGDDDSQGELFENINSGCMRWGMCGT
jgi:3'-phosphoadenosine 5'-phosphosulfate sulfotransferase (PAPS reductase)/FAD synthetase